MEPIRTAIIGLSASAITNWAGSAHLPYLLSPRGRARYRVVALCNSSVAAAKAAIETYQLPPETRAYGEPAALAADPDIDLVVCCTRVDRHYETVKPSIEAGKDVFVEWPLAHDVRHVRELADLARERGVRTAVGLQGRLAQIVLKIRELLEAGRIGKVLSSEVRAAGGSNSRDTLPVGLSYFAQRNVGGNVFTIGFAHLFDFVQFVLGEAQDVRGRLQLQRPEVKLRDRATGAIVSTTTSDVPDLVVVTGSLAPSPVARQDATLLVRFRRGEPFPGEAPLVWSINGEKGEIRLTSPGGTSLHAAAYSEPVAVEVHDFEKDEVEPVEWGWTDWQAELPVVARSVGALYEAFAAGDKGRYPAFEDALARHEQLGEVLRSWSPTKTDS